MDLSAITRSVVKVTSVRAIESAAPVALRDVNAPDTVPNVVSGRVRKEVSSTKRRK